MSAPHWDEKPDTGCRLSLLRGDATFFPARKKVAKEARFSFVLNYRHIKGGKGTVGKAVIGTHSSGGIVALFAEMLLWEYRYVAVCAFEDGIVLMMGLASS